MRSKDYAVSVIPLAFHADVLRLVTRSSLRSWGGTRDKPKIVCVGGYNTTKVGVVIGTIRSSIVPGRSYWLSGPSAAVPLSCFF